MTPPGADILAERNPGGLLGEAALSVYGAVGRIGAPAASVVLRWRERSGKEDVAHLGERWGHASAARPRGALVWVHCASVGETNAALPLIERLAARGLALLLTTGTVAAAEISRARLPHGATHQFVPIDVPTAVERFLDHWRPDLAIFAESELWPTMLRALRRRSLPLTVVNARMSERSFRSWHAFAPFARTVLRHADLFLAQTPADAERLRTLGADRVTVCGNLKFDVPPPFADPEVLTRMRRAIGGRPVLVAASTHAGEEEAILAAHRQITQEGARLLTIVAPRHRERGEAIAALVLAEGLPLGLRSRGDALGERTSVFLADTIGEMGLWYGLADIAFLGGSIVPHGGQNPIEPAKLGVPIMHGAHLGNFREIYDALIEANASLMVNDASALAQAVKSLIERPDERQRLASAALACVERFTGALERTLDALEPYLAPLCYRNEAPARA